MTIGDLTVENLERVRDPWVEIPNLTETTRWLRCPECGEGASLPVWTPFGWAIPWPHDSDCSELHKSKVVTAMRWERSE